MARSSKPHPRLPGQRALFVPQWLATRESRTTYSLRMRRLERWWAVAVAAITVVAVLGTGCSSPPAESIAAERIAPVADEVASNTAVDVSAEACAVLATSVQGIEVPLAPLFKNQDELDRWAGDVALTVSVEYDFANENVDRVNALIREDRDVLSYTYVNRQQALDDTNLLMQRAGQDPMFGEDFPASAYFRIVAAPAADVAAIVERYEPVVGVAGVITRPERYDAIHNAIGPREASVVLPDMAFGELLAQPFYYEDVGVFLDANADQTTIDEIGAVISSLPHVRSSHYVDREEVLQRVKERSDREGSTRYEDFVAAGEIVTWYDLGVTDGESVERAIQTLAGVDEVTRQFVGGKGGHLTFVKMALDQPPVIELFADLVKVAPPEALVDLDALASANDLLTDLPSRWFAFAHWSNMRADEAFLTRQRWDAAVQGASAVRSMIIGCGFEPCAGPACVNLVETLFPELTGG